MGFQLKTSASLISKINHKTFSTLPSPARGLPLANPERPTGQYPHRHHEHNQYCTRADGHKGFEYETDVETDPIQGSYADCRSVSEDPTLE